MRKKIVNNKDIVELVVEKVAGSAPSSMSLREHAHFEWQLHELLRMWLGPEALDDLIDALNEPDPHVRWCVVKALGFVGPGRAVPALVGALRDTDDGVRKAARVALRGVCRGEPSEEALGALQSAAKHADSFIRESVIEALGGLKSAKAMEMVPELIRALRDPEKGVRKAAASSLRRLTGKSFFFGGSDPEKWDKWWNENRERLVEKS
jgi:HEAT repeat protein